VPRPSGNWIAPNGKSLRRAPRASTRDSMRVEARRNGLLSL
jgi:hypothetical protein